MNLNKKLWLWLRQILAREPAPHRTIMVEDLPEEFRTGEIYLMGENGHFSCTAMMCPCGCGEVIQLNLVSGTRPVWTVELDSDTRAVTLWPSIWRTTGCRSHFLLRSGRVQWASHHPIHEAAPPAPLGRTWPTQDQDRSGSCGAWRRSRTGCDHFDDCDAP